MEHYDSKTYSYDNNMHPGPVPQELLVSTQYRLNIFVTCYLVVLRDPSGGDADLSSNANHVIL